METHEWLNQKTATEIMVRDVITLSPHQLLAEAAEVLLREQITGAPVIDAKGVCVGVLSASDIVGAEDRVAGVRQEVTDADIFHSGIALPVSVYQDKLAEVRDMVAPAAEQPVERFMTSDLVSVPAEANLREIVQSMVNAHIHRVVVLDGDCKLQGIVSTMDILAAMLHSH